MKVMKAMVYHDFHEGLSGDSDNREDDQWGGGGGVSDLTGGCRFLTDVYNKYAKIIKSVLGERDAGRSGFYGTSTFRYYGVPEFTAFGGTVCTVE